MARVGAEAMMTLDRPGSAVARKRCDMQPVAALFVRADSIYKTLPGVECYDAARDARMWPGGCPIVAHPPCRTWGSLKAFAKAPPHEHGLSLWAVEQIRRWGGVLEHPAASSLWREAPLPEPGWLPDEWGGWTFQCDQFHWGHLARKRTRLYIVGAILDELPPVPWRQGQPTHCVSSLGRHAYNTRSGLRQPSPRSALPELGSNRRDKTPPAFAQWLVELARRCGSGRGWRKNEVG